MPPPSLNTELRDDTASSVDGLLCGPGDLNDLPPDFSLGHCD